MEELEKLDASEIYPRRINAKEIWISLKGGEIAFPIADGTAKLSGRDNEFREPLKGGNAPHEAKIPVENF